VRWSAASASSDSSGNEVEPRFSTMKSCKIVRPATRSDKTAREEFGLTQDDIVQAIRVGKVHDGCGRRLPPPSSR